MSETHPNPQDFLGDDADEELVFDEPAPIAATDSPASAPKASRPRRMSRKADAAQEQDISPAPVPTEEPIASSSTAAISAIAEEPADGTSVPFPPQGAAPAGSKTNILLIATVGLSLLGSLVSVGGLITVSRSLAEADAARQEAISRQEALAGVPALVAQLNAASDRLDKVSARIAVASPSGPPATVADVQRELDTLKMALADHQPDGVSALSGATRDGFSEMSERLDRLSDQVEQMKGGVSASPPASHGAYPKHSS